MSPDWGFLLTSVGIVVIAVISLLVSFCGYNVLNWYVEFAEAMAKLTSFQV
jgi:hypothetical protein